MRTNLLTSSVTYELTNTSVFKKKYKYQKLVVSSELYNLLTAVCSYVIMYWEPPSFGIGLWCLQRIWLFVYLICFDGISMLFSGSEGYMERSKDQRFVGWYSRGIQVLGIGSPSPDTKLRLCPKKRRKLVRIIFVSCPLLSEFLQIF